MNAVIETRGLTRRFGKKTAVNDLNLSVREGGVYALLGPNGAGKTTTIKLLLNFLQPTEGGATVLGVESTRLGPDEFSKIGYVSENQELPGWMTVGQFIAFCRPMYPTWDRDLCSKMLGDFGLPVDNKIRTLSRGMKMKVALLTALAYRPRLLVLDEPFTGLDPGVREGLVRGILQLTDQENWSVFISSHDIDEVERIADWVGYLDDGRLRVSDSTEDLHARFKRLEFTVPDGLRPLPSAPRSWLAQDINMRTLSVIESQYTPGASEMQVTALFPGAGEVRTADMTLREIFLSLAHSNPKP